MCNENLYLCISCENSFVSAENSSLEGVTLDEGSITYITANMVPEAGDLGDTTLSLGEATNLQVSQYIIK